MQSPHMKRQNSIDHMLFLTIRMVPIGLIILVSMLWFQSCQSPATTEKSKVHTTDSLHYFSQLVTEQPSSDLPLLRRARYSYEQKSYAAALKDLEAALHIDSSRLETYLLKSQVEMDYFRSLESLRTLEKAEKLWPTSLLVKENLSQTHLILKQYIRAEEKANEAIQINPGAARPYLYLGLIAKENQDSLLAIDYLHQAVQNDADLLDAWVELARIQMEKNPEKAAPYFESALQIAPDELRIWHAYAMFWQHQDSLSKAKNTYDHMIDLDSGYVDAYYNKALIMMDQDSFETAIPLWNHYIQRQSESAKGYYYRGICFELTQRYSVAYADYLKAKNLNSGLANIDRAIQSVKTKLDHEYK